MHTMPNNEADQLRELTLMASNAIINRNYSLLEHTYQLIKELKIEKNKKDYGFLYEIGEFNLQDL